MNNNIVTMISELELLGFLKTNGTACRFVAVVTKTPVVDIRVSNPWGAGKKTKNGLYKVSRKIGIVNANYNTSVRRRIAEKFNVELKEVEYTNGEVWYEHLMTSDNKPLPVVQHKDESRRNGKYYLQYFPQKATSRYVNEQDEIVNDEIVEPWLYKQSERPDYKPTVIAVEFGNIKSIKISGIIIEMPELEEAEAILAD